MNFVPTYPVRPILTPKNEDFRAANGNSEIIFWILRYLSLVCPITLPLRSVTALLELLCMKSVIIFYLTLAL